MVVPFLFGVAIGAAVVNLVWWLAIRRIQPPSDADVTDPTTEELTTAVVTQATTEELMAELRTRWEREYEQRFFGPATGSPFDADVVLPPDEPTAGTRPSEQVLQPDTDGVPDNRNSAAPSPERRPAPPVGN
jgi:hypothetical protein